VAAIGDEDVRRLDVAMNDAVPAKNSIGSIQSALLEVIMLNAGTLIARNAFRDARPERG
jgi:hypothetical protein